MTKERCPKCKGLGKLSTMYREAMDARGPFYDRDVVYEMRTITVKCKPCNGTGAILHTPAGEKSE